MLFEFFVLTINFFSFILSHGTLLHQPAVYRLLIAFTYYRLVYSVVVYIGLYAYRPGLIPAWAALINCCRLQNKDNHISIGDSGFITTQQLLGISNSPYTGRFFDGHYSAIRWISLCSKFLLSTRCIKPASRI